MATISEPQAEGFRLSQLIYDTRYRSMTIQAVAFFLIMLGLYFLVGNVIRNYPGGFSFAFLGNRAGYDINQRLIEYSNDSDHSRAALVGILNTLLVAFLGCVAATFIGVFAGVLRLSKNWIVSRLMSVYVEGFRNVPLLLWILVIFAVFSESQPLVAAFREGGGADYSLFGLAAVTRSGTFIPRLVFSDGAFWVLLAVLILSIVANRMVRARLAQHQANTGQYINPLPYSLALLIIPVVAAFFVMSGITNSREQVLLAAGASEGQTLAEYAGEDRLEYCQVARDARSLNLERTLQDAGIGYRVIPNGNATAAVATFAEGNCALLAVPASQADSIMATITGLSARELSVEHAWSGITFSENENTEFHREAEVSVAPLSDTMTEGRAFEVSHPEITPTGIPRFEGGWTVSNALIALWFALSLYTGAFIAEIVRAGIQSVSKGQTEASYALGLRPSWTMNLVILPQALRVIVPPLISQFLNLTKNSSLALAVGYMDVRSTLGGITINQTGRELEGMLLLGGFYLVTSLIISAVMNVYNSSVKLKER
ncbi:MAG: ABC transporter permease subunit [Pseudomonadota bacterium]